MIAARDFVDAARARGFAWYSGVPCSYLTPFIDHVQDDASVHWLPAANEGDAVAIVAGLTLGGARGVAMMQNSGLGNAVSPLTSLTWTFRLPQLLIVTWRGEPGTTDEPQHALMGPITPALLDTMEIAHEPFPTATDAIAPALDRAVAHMERTGLPYALVMSKGSVGVEDRDATPVAFAPPRPSRSATLVRAGGPLPSRHDALARIVATTRPDRHVVLASTGYCGRELWALADRRNHLYLVGSMGCVTSVAMGLALARPDLVVVAIDGDGAALMRMGAFATVGASRLANLVHVLLDNGAHESTGGQRTVSPAIAFADVALACGYASAIDADRVDAIDHAIDPAIGSEHDDDAGPRFVRIAIAAGTPRDLPRPSISPVEVRTRLMDHLGVGRPDVAKAA